MMKKSCVVLLTYSGQAMVSSDWSVILSNFLLASDWSVILVTLSWLLIGQ